MNRRPREPRQLAGEDGSSKHGEESFNAGELSGERFFDANTDAIRTGKPLHDTVDADRATADVAFKPNCLGIQASIQEYTGDAEIRPQIQAENKFTAQSRRLRLVFQWR